MTIFSTCSNALATAYLFVVCCTKPFRLLPRGEWGIGIFRSPVIIRTGVFLEPQLPFFAHYFFMGSTYSLIEDKKSFSIVMPGTEDLATGSVANGGDSEM